MPVESFRANLNLTRFSNDSDPQVPQYASTTAFVSTPTLTPAILLDPRLNPYTLPPHNNRYADWDPGQNLYQRDHISLAALRLEYDLTRDMTLTSISSYADYSKHAYRDVDGLGFANDNFKTDGTIRVAQQELRLSGGLGDRLTYIFGGNYERDTASQFDQADLGPTSTLAGLYRNFYGKPLLNTNIATNMVYESKSAFGNLDFKLTDKLTARGGVRYTKLDGHSTGCVLALDAQDIVRFATAITINGNRARLGLPPITINRGDCYTTTNDGLNAAAATPQLHENNVAWRGTLDWKLTSDSLLYGTVSKGYKSGSFPQLVGTNVAQFDPATQESVLAYEAGVKATLFNQSVQLNGAVFYYDYKDKQFLGRAITPTGIIQKLVNVPSSRVAGAELQLDWRPVEGLRLTAASTYISTRIGAFSNYDAFGVVRNFEGTRFPFAPQFQGTLDTEYKHPVAGQLSAFLGGSLVYQSMTNSGLGELDQLKIPAYSTVDLRFGMESSAGWRLGAYVRNLGDKYYWNNAVRALDTVVRYTGLPRTYGLSFSYRM
jgi:outer membrane receptor protein involved in Fe transport